LSLDTLSISGDPRHKWSEQQVHPCPLLVQYQSESKSVGACRDVPQPELVQRLAHVGPACAEAQPRYFTFAVSAPTEMVSRADEGPPAGTVLLKS